MTLKDSLRPTESPHVMDLVSAAGVDVSSWAHSKKGRVSRPASNPAYCYEWAFTEPGRTVVVNLWHDQIEEEDGELSCNLSLREWSETQRHSTLLQPSQRSARSRRARNMDKAIWYAYENGLPVRVILGDGQRRDLSDPNSMKPSQMSQRLLDPEPWSVKEYDQSTGKCRLVRGIAHCFVDQFSIADEHGLKQREVNSTVWERDRCVRAAALIRANGCCEFCGEPGFRTAAGLIYLETHHVVPLSEGGPDHERNVIAICPNDHRQAHHGEHRVEIREQMLGMLAKIYGN